MVRRTADRARRRLRHAQSYAQWLQTAEEIDQLSGAAAWREEDTSEFYHDDLLRTQRDQMRRLREGNQPLELAYLLTHSLYRNLNDIQSPQLYGRALAGTKRLVTSYLDECELALQFLVRSEAFERSEKIRRFRQAAHVFGRSALMLSGGATLGFYHLGVVKGLFDEGLLPTVICGSSIGAMIAAGVCSRSDEELRRMYEDPGSIRLDGLARVDLRRALSSGAMMRTRQLHEVLRHNTNDLTFSEAFACSGRVLAISVSPTRVRQKPRLLTHLTAPDVLVASAALASSALPGLFKPVVLQMRDHNGDTVPYVETEKWVDGSIHGDLPKMRLSRLHNINHFIVSQTNPHVLPLAQFSGGARGTRTALTGLASSVAKNQSSGVIDMIRKVSGGGSLGLMASQAHTVISQDYRGDIDIHPRFDPKIYRKLLSNPSREDLDFFIREGQRAVWPKLAAIADQTRISRAFERCLDELLSGADST